MSFREVLMDSYNFEIPKSFSSYINHVLSGKTEEKDALKAILREGLAVANKFGVPDEEIAKRKRYSDLYITFLTKHACTWLSEVDHELPVILWKTNEITYMLSPQKLLWLEPYAQCMYGELTDDDRVVPNREEYYKSRSSSKEASKK